MEIVREVYKGRGRIWGGTSETAKQNRFGAATSLETVAEYDEDEIANLETGDGGIVWSQVTPKSVTLKMTIEEQCDTPTEIALAANMTEQTAGAVTGEAINVYPGGFAAVAHMINTGTAVTLTAAAWAASTAYTLGQIRSNGGNLYECITAGTSDASGGPSGTTADITDGTAHWKYLAASLVVDTDYEVTPAGIYIPASGSVITYEDGSGLLVSYARRDNVKVFDVMAATQKEWFMVFDGVNNAKDNAPVIIKAYKARFKPNSMKWIDKEHTKMEMEATLMLDPSKTGTGISKFMKVLKA